jgi:translation initiation factor IF-2
VWSALAEEGLLVEELGGDVQCALVSAKSGEGLEDLLAKVLLQVMLVLSFGVTPAGAKSSSGNIG